MSNVGRKVAHELLTEERARLETVVMKDGRVLGICHVCPKRVRDIRTPKNGVAQSGHMGVSVEEIDEWFTAHVRTDIHTYYRNDPPKREADAEERLLAQIFMNEPPAPTIVPFPFARRYR